mmetsp:Transcript_2935/g.6935  ORF Transcript_2935/g.6935 Transcript_2935/m.6935 type:complete len:127 (-) Transcript_2935:258-638(-)
MKSEDHHEVAYHQSFLMHQKWDVTTPNAHEEQNSRVNNPSMRIRGTMKRNESIDLIQCHRITKRTRKVVAKHKRRNKMRKEFNTRKAEPSYGEKQEQQIRNRMHRASFEREVRLNIVRMRLSIRSS